MDRTLDWRPRFDPRSLDYRMAAGARELPTTGRLWRHGPVLDQGAEGACVGFGCAGDAAAEPSPVPGVSDRYALSYYRRCQQLDEYPDLEPGTSVLAGCLTGRERGLWSGFRWAKSAEELAHGIVATASKGGGPAIIGVEWRAGSYDTDELGVLRPSGAVVGGHCLLVVGFVPVRPSRTLKDQLQDRGLLTGFHSIGGPAFVILNSWGLGFGQGGLALVPVDVMRAWVRAGGEFAQPIDRKVPTMTATAQHDQDEPPATTTLELRASELEAGDRVELTTGDVLGQDTHTVRRVQVVTIAGGDVAVVRAVAGTFRLSASALVRVRRAVA